MSYISDNLSTGEQLAYLGRVHWIAFRWAIIFIIVTLWLSTLPDMAVAAWLTGILLVIPAAILNFIGWKTTEFGITNRRILAKTGWIRRKTSEFQLSQIESVNVDQGILARVLGYGTLVAIGTGGSPLLIRGVSTPLEFRRQIYGQLDARDGETAT